MKRPAALFSLLVLFLVLSIQTAQAQEATGTVYGTVVNSQTGEPMTGVHVRGPLAVRSEEGGYEGPCWTPPRRYRVRLSDTTDEDGAFQIRNVPVGQHRVALLLPNQRSEKSVTVEAGGRHEVTFTPSVSPSSLRGSEISTAEQGKELDFEAAPDGNRQLAAVRASRSVPAGPPGSLRRRSGRFNTESYDRIEDNAWQTSRARPLSTFSIDVDAASYANVRRFLCEGRLPPKDAVRIEELINYFDYDYPQPEGSAPFSITTEVGDAPWNEAHRLVHVGLKGRELQGERPPSNLVFLLDVSGSMNSPRKLPLLKQSFQRLTERLGAKDRVAIVVYAGSSGLVLDATPGSQKEKIQQALGRLRAGGSTAGAAGIKLAYDVAQEHFIEGGNNRVILATDGDFNVGPSSDAEMTRLIERKRESGVFLTTLGFGTGNLKDSKMEALANTGNGNYYYLDTPREAEKVLGRELTSTLFTIARDVKVQVEFNPAEVERYRLIGYVNRKLDKEDFADDSTDAGELGAGHTVTALYEVVPGQQESGGDDVGELRYQTARGLSKNARGSGELMQVRLRYKRPDRRAGDASRLITRAVPVRGGEVAYSETFAFSAAVAGFGMLLRDSEHKGRLTSDQVLALAREGNGEASYDDRAEFIQLVERFQEVAHRQEEPAASR